MKAFKGLILAARAAKTKLFAGYRVLEGGSDSDEVCSFSLFRFLVAGVEARFQPAGAQCS